MNPMNNAGSRGANSGNPGRSRAAGKFSGDKIPSGYKSGQLANYTDEQNNFFSQIMGLGGEGSNLQRLAGGGDEELWNQIEAPAMRQFQGMQGDLASRFSGMGMGARRGSGFKNAANQQTMDFASQLQSQRQNLSRQAIQDLIQMSQQMMNYRPYERFMTPKEPGFFDKWLQFAGNTMSAAGKAAPGFAG